MNLNNADFGGRAEIGSLMLKRRSNQRRLSLAA